MNPDPNHSDEKAVAELTDALFTNGRGEEGDRLMLVKDNPHRDLGGWCRGAIRDRVLGLAARIRAEASGEVAAAIARAERAEALVREAGDHTNRDDSMKIKGVPTVRGWYWARSDEYDSNEWDVVFVTFQDGAPPRVLQVGEADGVWATEFSEFVGPLTPKKVGV